MSAATVPGAGAGAAGTDARRVPGFPSARPPRLSGEKVAEAAGAARGRHEVVHGALAGERGEQEPVEVDAGALLDVAVAERERARRLDLRHRVGELRDGGRRRGDAGLPEHGLVVVEPHELTGLR